MPFLLPGFRSDLPEAILRMAQAARINQEISINNQGQNNFAADQLAQMKMQQQQQQQQWENQFNLRKLAQEAANQREDFGLRGRNLDISSAGQQQTAEHNRAQIGLGERTLTQNLNLRQADLEKDRLQKLEDAKKNELADVEGNINRLANALRQTRASGNAKLAWSIGEQYDQAVKRANKLRSTMNRAEINVSGVREGMEAAGDIDYQKEQEQQAERDFNRIVKQKQQERWDQEEKDKKIALANAKLERAGKKLSEASSSGTPAEVAWARSQMNDAAAQLANIEAGDRPSDYTIQMAGRAADAASLNAIAKGYEARIGTHEKPGVNTLPELDKFLVEMSGHNVPMDRIMEALDKSPTWHAVYKRIIPETGYDKAIQPNADAATIELTVGRLARLRDALSNTVMHTETQGVTDPVTGIRTGTRSELTPYGHAIQENIEIPSVLAWVDQKSEALRGRAATLRREAYRRASEAGELPSERQKLGLDIGRVQGSPFQEVRSIDTQMGDVLSGADIQEQRDFPAAVTEIASALSARDASGGIRSLDDRRRVRNQMLSSILGHVSIIKHAPGDILESIGFNVPKTDFATWARENLQQNPQQFVSQLSAMARLIQTAKTRQGMAGR